MKKILILALLVIVASCKKDKKTAPNLSGTYSTNCTRTTPQTGHNSPYPDQTWEVVNVGGNDYRVDNLHPSGTGFAPRPFSQMNFTANNDGTLDLDHPNYGGTGTHSKTGMNWNFTEYYSPTQNYDWTCNCIKQ